MPRLPDDFLTRPLAHRGLHDPEQGIAENSRGAFLAAIDAGYGIELDLQLSADGEAMVFHDYAMGRLTAENGPIQLRSAEDLQNTPLKIGRETIPTLLDVLEAVKGRVPLLIEIKDQDGALGPGIGRLESRACEVLADYHGHFAFMSFNPHSIQKCAAIMPDKPRGLTTSNFSSTDWQLVPKPRIENLSKIPDFERTGSSFISHKWDNLDSDPVIALKNRGVPILCWTIRDPESEVKAREIANNVTFEGYLP